MFTQGYSQTEAQEMMTLSSIAYAGENTGSYQQIQQAIESELAASSVVGPYFQLVWLGITPDFSNLMYVARDNRETARFAVVVRGTDWNFLTDWKEDFDVIDKHDWPTASPPNPRIYVAQGSWDGMTDLLATQSNLFNMTPPAIPQPSNMITLFMAEALWNTYDTDVDIFVTGHSLGGAMATVIGLWLADTASTWVLRPNKVNFKTYTFAAPTVGNQDFVNYYNGQTANPQVQWQAYRVYNEQDAIPFGYANIGGVAEDGVPYSLLFATLELIPALAAIQTALDQAGVAYVDVGSASNGTALGLSNNPPSSSWPPPCNSEVKNFDPDFACWVGYEHDHNTYLFLLGAPTIPSIPQRAVDTAAIAATPLCSVMPITPETLAGEAAPA
ncbi:MAG TPA: lipase family protein [Longimicrobium sp.]